MPTGEGFLCDDELGFVFAAGRFDAELSSSLDESRTMGSAALEPLVRGSWGRHQRSAGVGRSACLGSTYACGALRRPKERLQRFGRHVEQGAPEAMEGPRSV